MVKTELREIAVDADIEAAVDVDAVDGGGGIKHTQQRKTWKVKCHAMSL